MMMPSSPPPPSKAKIKALEDSTLKKEHKADTEKNKWCASEIDKIEHVKKVLWNEISDLVTTIDDAKEPTTTLKAKIKALEDGIRACAEQCEMDIKALDDSRLGQGCVRLHRVLFEAKPAGKTVKVLQMKKFKEMVN